MRSMDILFCELLFYLSFYSRRLVRMFCHTSRKSRSKDKKRAGEMGIAEYLIWVDKKTRQRLAGPDRSSIHSAADTPFKVHLSRYTKSPIPFPCTFESVKFSRYHISHTYSDERAFITVHAKRYNDDEATRSRKSGTSAV